MIFPAIDLQDGRSVRLYKGDFTQETVINPDPVDQAKQYEAAKVGALHLVDLDGAKAGKPVNVDIVKAVRAAFTGILEIGGGIRDKEAIDLYLGLGVNRVILGSVALKIRSLQSRLSLNTVRSVSLSVQMEKMARSPLKVGSTNPTCR